MLKSAIFTPHNTINHQNKHELEEKLLEFINHCSQPDICVNFEAVEFVDGSALMVLVHAYKQAKQQKKNFYLLNVSPSIRIMLEISQLDQILAIKEFNQDCLSVKPTLVA